MTNNSIPPKPSGTSPKTLVGVGGPQPVQQPAQQPPNQVIRPGERTLVMGSGQSSMESPRAAAPTGTTPAHGTPMPPAPPSQATPVGRTLMDKNQMTSKTMQFTRSWESLGNFSSENAQQALKPKIASVIHITDVLTMKLNTELAAAADEATRQAIYEKYSGLLGKLDTFVREVIRSAPGQHNVVALGNLSEMAVPSQVKNAYNFHQFLVEALGNNSEAMAVFRTTSFNRDLSVIQANAHTPMGSLMMAAQGKFDHAMGTNGKEKATAMLTKLKDAGLVPRDIFNYGFVDGAFVSPNFLPRVIVPPDMNPTLVKVPPKVEATLLVVPPAPPKASWISRATLRPGLLGTTIRAFQRAGAYIKAAVFRAKA